MDNEDDVCDQCGRHFDRPGFYYFCNERHPEATKVQHAVQDVEAGLGRRKGMGWGHLDEEVQRDIRDTLAAVLKPYITPEGK
jgi:hypothetical protein